MDNLKILNIYNKRKFISFAIILVLLLGLIPPNLVKAEETDNIEEQLSEELGLDPSNSNLNIEHKDNEFIINTEINLLDENTSFPSQESTSFSEEIDNIGVSLVINLDTDTVMIQSKETNINGDEEEKEYTLDLSSSTDNEVKGTIEDRDTGNTYNYNPNEVTASARAAIPAGVKIAQKVLDKLIKAGYAAILAGSTYIVVDEFYKLKKTKSHYRAEIHNDQLFIGGGISKSAAINRLKSGYDTWSTNSSGAKSVAQGASPVNTSTKSEVDKKGTGKVRHYHPLKSINTGERLKAGKMKRSVHAFFGKAER
ncbi:SAR2788 family putative toxin [Niallia sp. FSL R7-0271]|uniref:SAR2788 family putative toxin n=1 Tax=Niallia sp. FSL R7-0271 TaxID=2921678 RepID=UPI0030FA6E06